MALEAGRPVWRRGLRRGRHVVPPPARREQPDKSLGWRDWWAGPNSRGARCGNQGAGYRGRTRRRTRL